MTSYKDNIYSGNIATTSANSSQSYVILGKTFNFAGNGSATAVTRSGTFPPNTQNVLATLYITNAGSANVSNKITVSAGGNNLVVIDQFGSAQGMNSVTTTSLMRVTPVVSAMASPVAPSPSANGGEIPFSVTFLPVTDDTTGTYQLELTFSRADTTWGPQGPYAAPTGV